LEMIQFGGKEIRRELKKVKRKTRKEGLGWG
jgi:hypothetical protein